MVLKETHKPGGWMAGRSKKRCNDKYSPPTNNISF